MLLKLSDKSFINRVIDLLNNNKTVEIKERYNFYTVIIEEITNSININKVKYNYYLKPVKATSRHAVNKVFQNITKTELIKELKKINGGINNLNTLN